MIEIRMQHGPKPSGTYVSWPEVASPQENYPVKWDTSRTK